MQGKEMETRIQLPDIVTYILFMPASLASTPRTSLNNRGDMHDLILMGEILMFHY